MKKFRNFINKREKYLEGSCVWDVVLGDSDPLCGELCEKIWPEIREPYHQCPCYHFGCKEAIDKLDAYLADYEAKHKKGGR
jgi:hypothetical protein